MDVDGGDLPFIAGLKTMDLNNPERNWEIYSNWADSIRSFPQVTKQKVRESMLKWVLVAVIVPTLILTLKLFSLIHYILRK